MRRRGNCCATLVHNEAARQLLYDPRAQLTAAEPNHIKHNMRKHTTGSQPTDTKQSSMIYSVHRPISNGGGACVIARTAAVATIECRYSQTTTTLMLSKRKCRLPHSTLNTRYGLSATFAIASTPDFFSSLRNATRAGIILVH